MTERWLPLPDKWTKTYELSSLGRIRPVNDSLNTANGHVSLRLKGARKATTHRVNALMLEMFGFGLPKKPIVGKGQPAHIHAKPTRLSLADFKAPTEKELAERYSAGRKFRE